MNFLRQLAVPTIPTPHLSDDVLPDTRLDQISIRGFVPSSHLPQPPSWGVGKGLPDGSNPVFQITNRKSGVSEPTKFRRGGGDD
jgi:hypothetical protein